jgi:hypothetical protein
VREKVHFNRTDTLCWSDQALFHQHQMHHRIGELVDLAFQPMQIPPLPTKVTFHSFGFLTRDGIAPRLKDSGLVIGR